MAGAFDSLSLGGRGGEGSAPQQAFSARLDAVQDAEAGVTPLNRA